MAVAAHVQGLKAVCSLALAPASLSLLNPWNRALSALQLDSLLGILSGDAVFLQVSPELCISQS